VAEAPGYYAVTVDAPVRSNLALPLQFRLARDPGPIPGALVRDIQTQLDAANALRDQGRLDQAITAYQAIQSRNAKLTSIGLVLGDTYRQRAAAESNAATRQSFLERAVASYQDVLKADSGNARAKAELEAVTADLRKLTP
jgi:tetratricopeptide (TPR) repeat protein